MEYQSIKHTGPAETIVRGFAAIYTLLGFLSIFYLPAIVTERRFLLVLRLGLFLLSAALSAVFFLISRRREGNSCGEQGEGLLLFRNKSALVLFAWFLWAVVACLLAVREGYSTLLFNGGFLLDQMVNFLVLFPLGLLLARDRDDSLLKKLAAVVYILFLPYLVSGLAVAFTKGSFTLFGRVICLEEERLRLGGNPNTAGIYAALAFTLGFFLLMRTHRRFPQCLIAAGELLLLVLMVSTGSRSALLATAAGIVYYAAALSIRRRGERRKETVRRSRAWIWAVGGVVLLFLVCIYRQSIPGLRGMIERFSGNMVLTRRDQLWKVMLHDFFCKPHLMLHGCSSADVPYLVQEIYGPLWNTHNQLLEICLGQGIPALVMFVIFLCLLLRDSLTVSLQGKTQNAVWAIPLVLLVLIVHSMAEVTLVNSGTTLGSIFFLTAGYVSGTGELIRQEKRSIPA